MEFYYVSKYPIKLCKDYMKHSNAFDCFIYTWEEKEDYYIITFKEYKSSTAFFSLANTRKPMFKVIFEELGDQTGVKVEFINPGLIIKLPSVTDKEIDKFWEKKLDAKRIKLK